LSSKATQARRAKLEKVTEERDKVRERLATMKKEAEAAEEGREETQERAEVVANLEKALEEKQKLEARLKDFADNDPAVMEQMVKETRDALEATNRWTDNIFSIQEWVKRKFPSVDQSGLSKQFGIPDDLDYMEL